MAHSIPQSTQDDRDLITSEEGRVPFVYDDAISPPRKYIKGTQVKGNLTAGVGHLLSRGNNIFPEANAWIGKAIPLNVINQWLDDDLNDAEATVDKLVKVPLTAHQRGTLFSFDFNVGDGGFAGSTLLKKLNAGKYNAVPAELQKWTKTRINGVLVTSKGLVKRRAMEAAYWLGGDAPAVAPMKTITPQSTEIALPKAKAWQPTEIIGAGSTMAGVAAAGFSTEGFLSYVFGGILIVVVLAVAAFAFKRYFFRG